MAYQDLKTLWYLDESLYQDVYHQRFNARETIKLNFLISGRQAFMCQSNEVMSLMYSVMRLDKAVSLLTMQLPGKALSQYSRKCLIDEIVLTNNIEGVRSTRKEIGDALGILEDQSQKKGKLPRFAGLVNKYSKLMSNTPMPLNTCGDIRSLYDEIVLPEVVAEDKSNAPDGKIFRKELSEIQSVTGKIIHKGVMPESEIIRQMEQALAFLNDSSIEPLYRICIFHYMFEYIHPFYDGNGRLGRFIFSYNIADNLSPLPAYKISETIKKNIRNYYDAFELCNHRLNLGDLTPFLIMMLTMIEHAQMDLYDSLTHKYEEWKRYETMLPTLLKANSSVMIDLYSYLLQAALFAEQGIPTKQLLSLLDLSYSTLRKYLGVVEQQNLLITIHNGNEKLYKLNLSTLDESRLDK